MRRAFRGIRENVLSPSRRFPTRNVMIWGTHRNVKLREISRSQAQARKASRWDGGKRRARGLAGRAAGVVEGAAAPLEIGYA